MKAKIKLFLFALIGLVTFSACQKSNQVTEKDCYYSDYYQSKPLPTEAQYYQSNLAPR